MSKEKRKCVEHTVERLEAMKRELRRIEREIKALLAKIKR